MAPGPRVAVITPYHREPIELLWRCHRSVAEQEVGADHIMVADGHANAAIDDWPVAHVRLPVAHDDNGNTPRGLASLMARNQGYDFIAYLDADNWYHPGHLRSLMTLWEAHRTPVCAALRTFHDAAGDDLGIHEGDEDALAHVDTSCLLIHRSGFAALPVWLDMPRRLSPVGDRVFLAGLRHHRLAIASSGARTVAFRSRYRVHYLAAGRSPPADAKGPDVITPARAYLTSADGVSDCVAALGFWPPSYVGI